MSKLKYFNKQAYSSLSEALGAIRKELEALQPQDSTDVVWSKSAEGISAKVRNGIIGEESQPVITESDDGDSVTTATYNGMHKLVLITDNSNPDEPTYKVCVCDGATYDPETQTSKESSVVFSGRTFLMASKVFDLEKKTVYILVKVSLYECCYIITDTFPYNDGTFWHYHIGTIKYKDNSPSIYQVHTDGTLQSDVSDYDGMHKLVLITDNSNPDEPTYKVCVCDGATYDPETQTSKASRVEVNGVPFDLDAQTFELKNKESTYIYILFTAATNEAEATVKYEVGPIVPDDQQYKTKTYILGSIVYNTTYDYLLVQQGHEGHAYIDWGIRCHV